MKERLFLFGLLPVLLFCQTLAAEGWDETFLDSQQCCECGAFELGGDWLYWKAEQGRMELGSNIALTPGVDIEIQANIVRPDFKYTSGYRIYGNYKVAGSGWKLGAIYTHLPSSGSVAVNLDPALVNTNFISLFTANFPILGAFADQQFSSIAAQWNLHVDYLDIDVSHSMSFWECLQICPHIGLRGLWMTQQLRISADSPTNVLTSKFTEKFGGYGVEGGLHAACQVGSGFSIIGHIGGALLYSHLYNNGRAFDVDIGAGTLGLRYEDNVYRATPTIDSFLGLQYARMVGDYSLSVHLGWEHHVVFDSNQLSIGGGGNLTMQGLTLGGSASF